MKGENFVLIQMSLLDCFRVDNFHFLYQKTKLIVLTESVVILCKFRESRDSIVQIGGK